MKIEWRAREVPLAPSAAAGVGPVATALAKRLLAMSDDALLGLRGVTARGVIAVLGPRDALPWVDGVVYLGRDDRAPSLLMPTTLEPAIAPELVERALTRGVPRLAPPLLILPAHGRVVSAGLAQPILRARLLPEVGT